MGLKDSGGSGKTGPSSDNTGKLAVVLLLLFSAVAGYVIGRAGTGESSSSEIDSNIAGEVPQDNGTGPLIDAQKGIDAIASLLGPGKNSSKTSSSLDPPQENCTCAVWSCQTTTTTTASTTSTTTTTTSTTTTTCVTVIDSDYAPSAKVYRLELRNGRFRPDSIEAFVQDTVLAHLVNTKGLYKFYDPINNRSIVLRPNDDYLLEFTAKEEGEFVIGCTVCEDPANFRISVVKPYKTLC